MPLPKVDLRVQRGVAVTIDRMNTGVKATLWCDCETLLDLRAAAFNLLAATERTLVERNREGI